MTLVFITQLHGVLLVTLKIVTGSCTPRKKQAATLKDKPNLGLRKHLTAFSQTFHKSRSNIYIYMYIYVFATYMNTL